MLQLADRSIEAWHRWACRVAFRLAPCWLPRDEVESAAGWALARALGTFDAQRGAWTVWLRNWLRSTLQQDLARYRRHGLVMRFNAKLPRPRRVCFETIARLVEARASDAARIDFEALVEQLDPREQTIVRGLRAGHTLAEIGRRLGVHEATLCKRVRALRNRGEFRDALN